MNNGLPRCYGQLRVFIYIRKNVDVKGIIESHFVQNNLVDEAFVKHVLIIGGRKQLCFLCGTFESVGDKRICQHCVVEVIAKNSSESSGFAAVDASNKSGTDAYVKTVVAILKCNTTGLWHYE